jgi:hypothetical protein
MGSSLCRKFNGRCSARIQGIAGRDERSQFERLRVDDIFQAMMNQLAKAMPSGSKFKGGVNLALSCSCHGDNVRKRGNR